MNPPRPLPAVLGGGGGGGRARAMQGVRLSSPSASPWEKVAAGALGLKAPSRARASKKMLSMLEEARGVSRFTRQNKQKDLLHKGQNKQQTC